MEKQTVISIDAMGGDFAPHCVLEGLALSVKKHKDLFFFLFGNELAFLCPTRGFYRDETGALGFLCSVYLGRIQDFMNFLSDTRGLPRETLQTYNFDAYERLENAGGLE